MSIEQLTNVVAGDEELRRRIMDLFHRMIDEAEYVLDQGSPNMRAKLLSTAIPAMMKSMSEDEATQMSHMREMFKEMNTDLRRALNV